MYKFTTLKEVEITSALKGITIRQVKYIHNLEENSNVKIVLIKDLIQVTSKAFMCIKERNEKHFSLRIL